MDSGTDMDMLSSKDSSPYGSSSFDADAPEAFADAVSAILADDTLHASLSEAARARFEAVARGWDSITAEYLEVLESIAAPPG